MKSRRRISHPINEMPRSTDGTFPWSTRDRARRVVLTILALLITSVGVVPAYASPPFPPDIKKIKDRGKLIVAQCSIIQPGFYGFRTEPDKAGEPYHLCSAGPIFGCDIALAMRIAKQLGVKLELDRSAKDFDSVCLQVANGKADIAISKLSITLERAQYVRFTKPYAVLGMGLLVNRFLEAKAGSKTDLWDLCNRPGTRIGVWQETAAETYARELFPRADLRKYDSFDKLFQAVVNREVFACLDEDFELRLRMHGDPQSALWVRFVQVPKRRDLIAIAVSPNSPNLLAFLNLFLEYEGVTINVDELLRKTAGEIKTWCDAPRKAPVEGEHLSVE